MPKRFKLNINHNSEFELDLAPLLAVMVKLVPVLLVSSAFVQMMIIETELPQVVQQAIENDKKNNQKNLKLEVDPELGVIITLTQNDKEDVFTVKNIDHKNIDFQNLHLKLREIKAQNPEIFKIDFAPHKATPYKDVVKIMDEARKSRDSSVKFPIKDLKTGQEAQTDYMFPEIIFSQTMDG